MNDTAKNFSLFLGCIQRCASLEHENSGIGDNQSQKLQKIPYLDNPLTPHHEKNCHVTRVRTAFVLMGCRQKGHDYTNTLIHRSIVYELLYRLIQLTD